MALNPLSGSYNSFKKILDAIASLRCKGCREGCPLWCKIRRCAQGWDYESRAQCEEFESGEKLTFLETGHKYEHLKSLRKIRKAKAYI